MKQFVKGGQMDVDKEMENAIALCKKIQLKANDITAPPSSLSGGNQQKVVVAKMLSSDQKVLIMDEPTKGIDVGAKYSIYEIMNSLACKGYGIIMVSSEMPEVLGVADRVVVMKSGRVTGEFGDMETVTQEMLLEASLKEREGHK
jgi:rhamnose transport system ATP-binding protein